MSRKLITIGLILVGLLFLGLELSEPYREATSEEKLAIEKTSPLLTSPHETGERLFQNQCAKCHGPKGKGSKDLKTPAIASLPKWYIKEQLTRFKNGVRGAHPQDINGQIMRAVALQLSDKQVSSVLAYLKTLKAHAPSPTLKGELNIGKLIYRDECMGCHRFNGHGMSSFYSAPLNGLQDWYLLEQLNKFDQGIRAYHPKDARGEKMKHLVKYLSEKDRVDVLTYITTLASKYPVSKE